MEVNGMPQVFMVDFQGSWQILLGYCSLCFTSITYNNLQHDFLPTQVPGVGEQCHK